MAGARWGRAGRDEDEVGQGGGVAEECQGRGGEVGWWWEGVTEKVS